MAVKYSEAQRRAGSLHSKQRIIFVGRERHARSPTQEPCEFGRQEDKGIENTHSGSVEVHQYFREKVFQCALRTSTLW